MKLEAIGMAHAKCPQCGQVAHFQINEKDESRQRERYKEDEDGYLKIDLCLVCGWGGIDRSVDQGGYFTRELAGIGEVWPRMGRLCGHCNLRIPRFLELPPGTATRARGLFKLGRPSEAIKMVMEATGCPQDWARLWVEHPAGAVPGDGP